MGAFVHHTVPVINFFTKLNRCKDVDAFQSIDKVASDIENILMATSESKKVAFESLSHALL
jgi:hypothetical protein